MIFIKLYGQLGNQMFQYSVARLAAERLRCGLLIEEQTFRADMWSNLLRGRSSYSLFDVYPDLDPGILGYSVAAARALSHRLTEKTLATLFPHEFIPSKADGALNENDEQFDERICKVGKYTRLVGYFQSEKYFAGNEARVKSWFAPRPADAAAVSAHWAQHGLDPNETVAVHVRLGDYQYQGTAAGGERGWVLPRRYYDRALATLGRDYPIALFSDMPQQARELLGRPVAYLSDGADLKRDFFLMSSCRQIVAANSTYSWWAAWLNSNSGRTIIAPKYHIGWRIAKWYPAGIEVKDFTYVQLTAESDD